MKKNKDIIIFLTLLGIVMIVMVSMQNYARKAIGVQFRDMSPALYFRYNLARLDIKSREGIFKIHDDKMNLELSLSVNNGRLDGLQRFYFPNGKLYGLAVYNDGNLIFERQYDDAGKLIFQKTY